MAGTPMNFKNAHALWSAVFMRTLRNCGVRLLAFAPDAALSPLADAAAETPRLDAVPAPDARAEALTLEQWLHLSAAWAEALRR